MKAFNKLSLMMVIVLIVSFVGIVMSQTKDSNPTSTDVNTHSVTIPAISTYLQLGDDSAGQQEYQVAAKYYEASAAKDSPDQVLNHYIGILPPLIKDLISKQLFHDANDRLAALERIYEQALKNYHDRQMPLDGLWAQAKCIEDQRTIFKNAVNAKAQIHIQSARQEARNAWHWYWFNNRDAVRNGLSQLKWVRDHLSYLDDTTHGQFIKVLSDLKNLVSDKEFVPLSAEAGIVAS